MATSRAFLAHLLLQQNVCLEDQQLPCHGSVALMLSSVLLFGFIQPHSSSTNRWRGAFPCCLRGWANLCDNMQTHPVTDLLSGRTRCRKSLSKRAVCSFAFGKSCRASAEIRAHDAQAWPCSIASCRSVVFSWRFTFARFSMKSCSMSELPCAAAFTN